MKICHFIFCCSCDFAFNALFYSNEKISDRYHYEGDNLYLFTLINNLTVTVTCSIVGLFLRMVFHYLINSKKKLERVFREQENKLKGKNKNEISASDKIIVTEQIIKILKILKFKIIGFIIFELFFMLFFTYYIAAFCSVYKNTQISWLSDSIVSFIIISLAEVVMSFILAILYTISIKYKNKTVYNIVLFIYDLGH